MATLLLHVSGNRSLNYTIFAPHLYIYDNLIYYKKGHIFSHDEVTINYNHISHVNLHKLFIFFAHIEIVSTGNSHILVKWIEKSKAKKAKEIIDQKVYQLHKIREHQGFEETGHTIDNFEMSLKRLNELLSTGKISKSEYANKRKQLLKRHY